MRLFLHKLTHWEYWPFCVVYFPVFFLWIYYSFRAGTIFFFNAANPGIRNGGFMSESKMQIYDLLPENIYPETILIYKGEDFESVAAKIYDSGLSYPLIAKPDIGLRGSAVRKIENDGMLRDYCKKADFDFLVQRMIPFSREIGIFYVRYSKEASGQITGIVSKEFLIVSGDGRSTIRELLKKDPRHEMQTDNIAREHGALLDEIPADGQRMNLVPYGNHVRGAKFTDVSYLISEKLSKVIDDICVNISGFYFGRLDIMFDDLAALENGRDFQIVEVNGSSSEPTHIYDPKHSIFFAWKELFRHIRYMYEIGAENNRRGVSYLTFSQGIEQYRIHRKQSKKIINF